MSSTVLYMSMSLDGFIAGPEDGPGNGLGNDGERLHAWLGEPAGGSPPSFQPPGESGKVFDEMLATGAVVVGRRTFDLADRWSGDHHGVPIFVPTRGEPPEPPSDLVHYVTDGVESAVRQAKEAAGEADVMVHGADLTQSLLRAGGAGRARDPPRPGPAGRRPATVRAPRRRPHRARAHTRDRCPRRHAPSLPGAQSTATRLAASSASASASSMISPSGPRT